MSKYCTEDRHFMLILRQGNHVSFHHTLSSADSDLSSTCLLKKLIFNLTKKKLGRDMHVCLVRRPSTVQSALTH